MMRIADNISLSGWFMVGAGLAVGLFLCSPSIARERHAVSFKTPAKSAVYTQQHSIDVGDVPGHKIRLYEIRRAYTDNAPEFAGVALKEVWRRGYSDYTHVSGRAWGYDIYVLASGDRIFLRWSGTSAAPGAPGKQGNSMFVGILTITGGTGKFLGIRGTLKESVIFSPESGLNEALTQGTYWFEK